MNEPADPPGPNGGGPPAPELRLLVTGAAGFIGSHLCERLVADGHAVWGLDNYDESYAPALKRRNVAAVAQEPDMHLVEGDLRDSVLLDGLFSDVSFDAVIHLAARVGILPSVEDPARCFDTNVSGTIELLEAMRRHHTQMLVLGSSASVYGNATAVPFEEETPADRPASPLAASKRAAELLCHSFHELYGFSVHCLRLSTVYGPRQRPDLAIRKFAALMAEGEPLPIYGDGSASRDYTYVSDAVGGIVLSLEHLREKAAQGAVYEVFNLGGSEPTPLDDLVERLGEALGLEPSLSHEPPRQGDVAISRASLDRSRELLGYEPQVKLDEGLARFARWFWEQRENGSAAVTRSVRHGYAEAEPAGG